MEKARGERNLPGRNYRRPERRRDRARHATLRNSASPRVSPAIPPRAANLGTRFA